MLTLNQWQCTSIAIVTTKTKGMRMTSFIGSIFKEKQDADSDSSTNWDSYSFMETESVAVYNMRGNPIEIIADVQRAAITEKYVGQSRDNGRGI